MHKLNIAVLFLALCSSKVLAQESSACPVDHGRVQTIQKMMADFNARYAASNLPRMKRCGMTCDKYKEFCKNQSKGKMAFGDGMILRGQLQDGSWPETCQAFVKETLTEVQIKLGYLQNGFKNCESCDFSKPPSSDEPGC